MQLHCSGYLWTHALWTANICQVSQIHWTCVALQNKIICKSYLHVNNNVITISNYLLSYDNYFDKTIHFHYSTLSTFRLPSTLDKLLATFQCIMDLMCCWHKLATNNRSVTGDTETTHRITHHKVGEYTSPGIYKLTNTQVMLLRTRQMSSGGHRVMP